MVDAIFGASGERDVQLHVLKICLNDWHDCLVDGNKACDSGILIKHIAEASEEIEMSELERGYLSQ